MKIELLEKIKFKKLRFRTVTSVLFILLSIGTVKAQEIAVSGVVTSQGLPLAGATVLVKGTSKGTITDFDGNYVIQAKPNETLSFTYIGYIAQEIAVGNQTTINVVMKEDLATLDEVVVVGYGKRTRKEIGGAVAQVKAETIEKTSTSDVGAALQGQIAGVNVQSSGGQPGASANIRIRGVNSVLGSSNPLYVVDGIPQDGDPQLSVSEIETIDVLKDAASAAIYGTRGSAGVILITTKTGKEGKMEVSVKSYVGYQDITSSLPLLTIEDYFYSDFLRLYNSNGTFVDNSFQSVEQNPANLTNNTEILSLLQNDNALIQNHSVNISGGQKGLTYNVNANYFDQEGILLNSGLKRMNIRANTALKKNKWTFTTGIGLRIDEQTNPPFRVLLDGFRYKPYQPEIDLNSPTVEDAAGNTTNNDAVNLSFLSSRLRQTDTRFGDQFNIRFQVDNELTDNITLTARTAISRHNILQEQVSPLFQAFDVEGVLIPQQVRSGVTNRNNRNTSFTAEGILNYDKTFGDHRVRVTAVASREQFGRSNFFGEINDLVSNDITVLDGGLLDANVGGTRTVNTLTGYLGRLQYDYKGKYIISASVRQDGSSRFSAENRYVTSPSASFVWSLSDEPFWEYLEKTVNTAKIRISYGTLGNQGLPDYIFAPTITLNRDYIFGSPGADELILGAIQTEYATPDIKWEQKKEINIGYDLTFLDRALTFSFDYYDGKRSNMLLPVLIPGSVGSSSPSVTFNAGDMRNYGNELALSYRNKGKFSWTLGATWARNQNEITKVFDSNSVLYLPGSFVAPGLPNGDLTTVIREGYEAGAFFLIENDGLIRTSEELAEYKAINPVAQIGDLRLKDQLTVDTDGDGIPDQGDGLINDNDRVYKGSGAPEFETGLNFTADYKGLDFSMQWYGAFGGEIINGSKNYAYRQGTHRDLLYQYTAQNPTSTIPAYRGRDYANYRGFTDYWIQDGSFVRLRNIQLGYTLPQSLTKKLGLTRLRFYVAADNPLTITDYDGFDPEVGNDGLNTRGIDSGTYPITSQYRAGLEFKF